MSTPTGELRLGRTAHNALGLICLAAFLGAVGWILYLGVTKPIRNFDLMDYVALAVEWVEHDPAKVQERTYAIAKAELPPEMYADFESGSPFRQQIHGDWKLFDANLGFHRGRYLYTLAVLVLHELGARWTAATWYLNQLFFGLSALLVLVWGMRRYSLPAACVLGLGVLYSPPVLSLVPASSPDAMAMFGVALGLFLMIEQRAFRAAAVVLALTVLVRSDFVLIPFGVAPALLFFVDEPRRPSGRFLLLWLAGCTGVYLLVSITARDPGWWAVFLAPWRRQSELDAVPAFSTDRYAFVLRHQLESIHFLGYELAPDHSFVRGSTFVLVYLGAAVVGAVLALRTRLLAVDLHLAVLCGLIAATAARYVLFPYLWDRYFVYLWVPVPLCLASLAAALVEQLQLRPERAPSAPG